MTASVFNSLDFSEKQKQKQATKQKTVCEGSQDEVESQFLVMECMM